MSSKGHTALPWKWHWRFEDGIATGSIYSEARPGHAYSVAKTPRYQTKDQWEADARLIVESVNAMPALREALRGLLAYVDREAGVNEVVHRGTARGGFKHCDAPEVAVARALLSPAGNDGVDGSTQVEGGVL